MPTHTEEMPTITAKDVRTSFSPIMGKVDFGHTPYVVTNRGRKSMVLIGVEDYEDMIDLMDTMAEQLDSEFQQSLKEGKKDIEEGRGILFADLKKSLQNK